jgi:hypothetical protein
VLQGQEIVVPNELAEIDGNTYSDSPSGMVTGLRVMHIYDASEFQALTKPSYLTGFAVRPD